MNKYFSPDQFPHPFFREAESWQQTLTFQRDELLYFQNRLGEVINASSNPNSLLVAEQFQEEFLEQERIIDFMTSELNNQLQLLQKSVDRGSGISAAAEEGQLNLRREFAKAEELFTHSKANFMVYIQSIF
ncbi:hypothetical protein [Flavisolibacter nicotianae]|uniref:hypothetical protein n=1 Tax=Flavisolibacter nicotianae TaxID=2364882 RepID=UPI000EAEA7D5|nr:hypothetical protein [Flavisolibacter nicotianae]